MSNNFWFEMKKKIRVLTMLHKKFALEHNQMTAF